MNLRNLLRPALLLALFATAAPAAHAGDLKLSFGGKKGKVTIHAGSGYGGGVVKSGKIRHGYGPPQFPKSSCSLHTRCAPKRHWVPGHYELREHQVWIPESKEKVFIPPVYETRYTSCGQPYQVMVQAGHWTVVCNPGHFETRTTRAWVPGKFEASCAVY